MDKIIFKDGPEIEGGGAYKSSNDQLMVRIPGKDLMAAATLLSNPEKTAEIVFYTSIYKYTYKGFTELYSIQVFENYVEGWLKGENTNLEKEVTVPKEYVPWEADTNA